MYNNLDLNRMPKKIGNQRFTFTNALQSKEQRREKYRLLRQEGFTAREAHAMRDYRQEIIDKRIAILKIAGG